MEEERLWRDLIIERVTKSADACQVALNIMTSPHMPKAVYLEDVIERVLQYTKFHLQNTLYPQYDPAYRVDPHGGLATNLGYFNYISILLKKIFLEVVLDVKATHNCSQIIHKFFRVHMISTSLVLIPQVEHTLLSPRNQRILPTSRRWWLCSMKNFVISSAAYPNFWKSSC